MRVGRLLRIAAGAIALAGGLYLIIGEQMAGTSADAVINAGVVTLRAPIDGIVATSSIGVGARVGRDQLIGVISDPRPDDIRLTDLKREEIRRKNELDRLEALTASLQEARSGFETQAHDYAEGRVNQLRARVAEANSAVQATQARVRESEQNFNRASQLIKTGSTTGVELDRVQAAATVNQQEVLAAQQRLNYVNIEYQAALKGTFLSDTSNDVPYSQQRIKDIDLRIAEAAAQIQSSRSALNALHGEIQAEDVRISRFREARLIAPGSAVLWSFLAGSGEYVRRGQDLVRLVDCNTSMVTASVRESLYNRLKVGDQAQFLLNGSSQVYHGAVARLAGSGTRSIYDTLAISPGEEHLKRYDVTLILPDLMQNEAVACAVGRTGRVVFSARPLDVFRRWMVDLGLF